MYEFEKEEIRKLEETFEQIGNHAIAEGRALRASEMAERMDLLKKIEEKKKSLPASTPLTLQNFSADRSIGYTRGNGGYELRSPGQSKDWTSLFGDRGYVWPDKETNFFSAVFSGRHHPGLTLRSMTETVQSDGGFLVPSQTAAMIHAVSLENEIVMPNAFVQPMQSNEMRIPGVTIGSNASSLMGFTASYVQETGTIGEHDPKFRYMVLNAKKLTGYLRWSSELNADIPGGFDQIINICGKGLAWYRDKFFLAGNGAGQPLGITNSSCLVSVAKETGQRAATIVYENVIKMMGRMFPGSFKNSIWICHQSTIPQLLQLSLAIGTSGTQIPVMSQTDGKFSMLTRPVIFTEKTSTLGTKGDIMLVDLSQYVIGLREEMRFDTSIHVAFTTDELVARLIERHDGQPLWNEYLTLADGTTTVSPFVTLDTRA